MAIIFFRPSAIALPSMVSIRMKNAKSDAEKQAIET
jgi:hypothetical protein